MKKVHKLIGKYVLESGLTIIHFVLYDSYRMKLIFIDGSSINNS